MTADHQYCLSDNEKLLNDYCLEHRHVCLHLGGMLHTVHTVGVTKADPGILA